MSAEEVEKGSKAYVQMELNDAICDLVAKHGSAAILNALLLCCNHGEKDKLRETVINA